AGIRVPGIGLRIDIAIERIEIRAAKGSSQHVFHAERMADGLTDLNILGDAFLRVENEDRIAEGLEDDRLRCARSLQLLEGFDRDGIDVIILAGYSRLNAGIGIRNGYEADFIEILMTRSAITVAFAVTRLVAVEANELDILVRFALLQHI